MKALRVAPWLAALAVLFVACVPPSSEAPDSAAIKARPAPTTKKAPTPKNAPTSARKVAKAAPAKVEKRPAAEKPRPPRGAEKPKQAAETPEKKPVAKPSAKPQQPPAPRPPKPPKIFVFSPQRRSSFVPGEAAQVTVVVYAPQPLPRAEVILKVKGEGDLAWTATDELGSLSAGRHSLTYGLSAEHFAPGDYSLSVTLGAAKPATWKFTVGPAVQRTHFPIAAWLSDAPSNPIGARRLRDALGFNMAVVSQRSAWRAKGVNVIDADYLARMAHLASHPDAAPLEQSLEVPPFVRCGDLLTGAGLPWVSGCAVSGGVLPPLLQAAGSSGPDVLAIGVQRLQHRLAAERRFANCIGVHLTEETGLEGSPEPKKGKKNKSPQDTMRARAQAYATFLRRGAEAARALCPEAIVVGELGEATALRRGIYPPQVAGSVPTVLVRAGLDSPAGTILSPFLADLARAGGGARRVWLMPQVARDAEPDELRTVISLALARKIDGVVLPGHMDYYLKRAGERMADALWRLPPGAAKATRPRGRVLLAHRAHCPSWETIVSVDRGIGLRGLFVRSFPRRGAHRGGTSGRADRGTEGHRCGRGQPHGTSGQGRAGEVRRLRWGRVDGRRDECGGEGRAAAQVPVPRPPRLPRRD